VCLRKAATIASFSAERTVERTSLGHMGASCTKARFFDLASVQGFRSYRALNSLIESFDHSIAAGITCVVLALP
jgi:hypothetical protein